MEKKGHRSTITDNNRLSCLSVLILLYCSTAGSEDGGKGVKGGGGGGGGKLSNLGKYHLSHQNWE